LGWMLPWRTAQEAIAHQAAIDGAIAVVSGVRREREPTHVKLIAG
jgi:hypothetical protein